MLRRVATVLLTLFVALPATGCRLIAPKPREYMRITLPSGVSTQDLVIPLVDGLPYARRHDRLTLHYTATLDDGSVIDSSLDSGVPITLVLGDDSVPPGLQQGLFGMRELAERRVWVPPDLAYGAEGVPGMVPPGSRVTFTVELVDLERPEAEDLDNCR